MLDKSEFKKRQRRIKLALFSGIFILGILEALQIKGSQFGHESLKSQPPLIADSRPAAEAVKTTAQEKPIDLPQEMKDLIAKCKSDAIDSIDACVRVHMGPNDE